MKIIKKSKIDGCFIVELKNFDDNRGFFNKIYSDDFLNKFLRNKKIKQVNYSLTKKKYSIRGLHYQNPFKEFKLVKCIEGKIFDVVVDLRKKSKTFLKHENFILDSKKPQLLVIPENCAHGYQTLSGNVKILYLHTNLYIPKYSKGLNYKDPKLNIRWPFSVSNISLKDHKLKLIGKSNFKGL